MTKSKNLIILVLTIILSCIVSSGVFAADPDLVLQYKFDDISGEPQDSSGNGLNGAWYNNDSGNQYVSSDCAPIPDNTGCINFSIDTDAGVEFPDLNLLNESFNWSVTLWVKAYGFGSRYIFSLCAESNMDVYAYNGYVIQITDINPTSHGIIYGTVDTWYDFVMTYNEAADNFSIYSNGFMIYTDTVTTIQPRSAYNVLGGEPSKATGPSVAFNGLMDDVRIYSKSLTGEEVMNLYLYNNLSAPYVNTPPTVPIIISPVDGMSYNIVDLQYASTDMDNDPLTYYVYIDDVLNATTASNITGWSADDGIYTLKVSAYDGTNFSDNSSSVSFTRDTVAPIVQIIKPVNASIWNTDTVYLDWSGSGFEICSYELDYVNYTGLIVDNLVYQETANEFGNTGQSNLTYVIDGNWEGNGADIENGYFMFNYTKPANVNNVIWQIKAHCGASVPINWSIPTSCWNYFNDKIALQINGIYSSDHYLNYSCYDGSWNVFYDSGPSGNLCGKIYEEAVYWNSSSSINITLSLADGYHSLNLYCSDEANNIGQSGYVEFYIDSAPPVITVNTVDMLFNDTYNNLPMWINLTTDEVATCVLDEPQWTLQFTDGLNHAFADLANATEQFYNIVVSCNDSLGNLAQKNIYFTIDRTPPFIYPVSPSKYGNTSLYTFGTFDILVSGTDNAELYAYYANITKVSDDSVMWTYSNETLSGTVFNFSQILDVSGWQNTTYRYCNMLCDKDGGALNCDSECYNFLFKQPPVLALTVYNPVVASVPGSLGQTVNFDIEVNSTDLLALFYYDWTVDNVTVNTAEDFNYLLSSGYIGQTHHVTVSVTDDSGFNNLVTHDWDVTILSGHTVTYDKSDMTTIVIDGLGTAGAAVVGNIDVLIITLVIFLVAGIGISIKNKFRK